MFKIEQLQEIIEKKAHAKNYVYPPKPEEIPTIASKFTEKRSPTSKETGKGETERQKLRRQLTNKMKFKEEEYSKELAALRLDYATELN